MDTYRTEEEQIEHLKKLWKEQGSKVIALVSAALLVFALYQYYHTSKANKIATASAIYEQIVEGVDAQTEAKTKEANLTHLYGQLEADFASSAYTQYAGLLVAKFYASEGQFEQAAEKLNAVIANANAETKELAQWRLARVLFAQTKHDEALSLLNAIDAKVYGAGINELKGDIAVAQNDAAAAGKAYAKALELAKAEGENVSRSLQIKADNYAELDEKLLVKAAQ